MKVRGYLVLLVEDTRSFWQYCNKETAVVGVFIADI